MAIQWWVNITMMEENKKIVKPYNNNDSSKKEEVAEMFNNISKKYDFLNHFFSLGIDKIWRKQSIKLLKELSPKRILDIATGTGDFAIAALKLKPKEVIGVDISQGMLDVGIEKMVDLEIRVCFCENLVCSQFLLAMCNKVLQAQRVH